MAGPPPVKACPAVSTSIVANSKHRSRGPWTISTAWILSIGTIWIDLPNHPWRVCRKSPCRTYPRPRYLARLIPHQRGKATTGRHQIQGPTPAFAKKIAVTTPVRIIPGSVPCQMACREMGCQSSRRGRRRVGKIALRSVCTRASGTTGTKTSRPCCPSSFSNWLPAVSTRKFERPQSRRSAFCSTLRTWMRRRGKVLDRCVKRP